MLANDMRRKAQISALVRPAALTALTNVLMALPAHAEAGKIFDFNLTLPVMVAEFLVLMVFLDKFWFTPVGNTLDERDKLLRDKLASVKVRYLYDAVNAKSRLGAKHRGPRRTTPASWSGCRRRRRRRWPRPGNRRRR